MKVKLRVSRFGRIVLAAVVLVLHLPADEPIRDAICDQFDLEPCEIFLSGTHTHSGPTPTLGEDGHPNNLDYTREVLVMKLTKLDGTPTAALFDYATHATSLGPRNLQISGDVLGIAAQFVEKILGPDVAAPVFAGASGDMDPWY